MKGKNMNTTMTTLTMMITVMMTLSYLMTNVNLVSGQDDNGEVNKSELVDQHDCVCTNTIGGLYCGSNLSEYVKFNQGKGCRKDFLYNCTAKHLYPLEIFACAKGYDCKVKGEGMDECEEEPPQPNDCKCTKMAQKEGLYCGSDVSKYLQSNEGLGCRRDHLYHCDKNGGGKVAKLSKQCKKYYVCVSSKANPEKGKCVAPKPDPADCKCKNTVEGNYCGGSKYLESKDGLGCQRNYIFNCIAYGGENNFYPDSDKTKKCKSGEVCVSGKSGKAFCQKK